MSAPLAGQSGNLLAGFGEIASKTDVLEATEGVTEDIGDIFDQLDGFGSRIDTVEVVADNAAETADIAYANAQYWKDEFVVSSAGLLLGFNELVIGVVMDVPTSRTRRVTDLHYALLTNTATVTVELIKIAVGGGTSVAHTATFTGTRQSYNNLTIDVLDKERIACNVTVISGGTASVLQTAVVGVLL